MRGGWMTSEWNGRFANRLYEGGKRDREGVMGNEILLTPLRCVQNDMWEGRDGSPHPRGQRVGEDACRYGTGGSRTALTRGGKRGWGTGEDACRWHEGGRMTCAIRGRA